MRITRPVAFTGKKARRLLIHADATALPPWGNWAQRGDDEEQRRAFTRLRSTINRAIAPHEVDHIEFLAQMPFNHGAEPAP